MGQHSSEFRAQDLKIQPEFFEPEFMASPPNEVLEYLERLQNSVTFARHRLRSCYRYQPTLNGIPEDDYFYQELETKDSANKEERTTPDGGSASSVGSANESTEEVISNIQKRQLPKIPPRKPKRKTVREKEEKVKNSDEEQNDIQNAMNTLNDTLNALEYDIYKQEMLNQASDTDTANLSCQNSTSIDFDDFETSSCSSLSAATVLGRDAKRQSDISKCSIEKNQSEDISTFSNSTYSLNEVMCGLFNDGNRMNSGGNSVSSRCPSKAETYPEGKPSQSKVFESIRNMFETLNVGPKEDIYDKRPQSETRFKAGVDGAMNGSCDIYDKRPRSESGIENERGMNGGYEIYSKRPQSDIIIAESKDGMNGGYDIHDKRPQSGARDEVEGVNGYIYDKRRLSETRPEESEGCVNGCYEVHDNCPHSEIGSTAGNERNLNGCYNICEKGPQNEATNKTEIDDVAVCHGKEVTDNSNQLKNEMVAGGPPLRRSPSSESMTTVATDMTTDSLDSRCSSPTRPSPTPSLVDLWISRLVPTSVPYSRTRRKSKKKLVLPEDSAEGWEHVCQKHKDQNSTNGSDSNLIDKLAHYGSKTGCDVAGYFQSLKQDVLKEHLKSWLGSNNQIRRNKAISEQLNDCSHKRPLVNGQEVSPVDENGMHLSTPCGASVDSLDDVQHRTQEQNILDDSLENDPTQVIKPSENVYYSVRKSLNKTGIDVVQ